MNTRSRLITLPLAALTLATALVFPSFAQSAQAQILEGGPIVVDSCTVNHDGDVSVSYHNRRPIAANRVVFEVGYRGYHRRVVDVGTFTQYAEIQHRFEKGLPFEGPVPNFCAAVTANFVNGTTWYR